MPYFEATEEQAAILSHDPGIHARVLAGPGTGKSATLVALIDQLLAGSPAPRVRLLTFTRAATGELATKVSEHPSAAAERPSTIHSFAISVLLTNPGTGDFPHPLRVAEDWEYKEIVRPSLARRTSVSVRDLDKLVQEMAAAWQSLEPEHDPGVDEEMRSRFLGAWNEHRRIYGYTLLQELPHARREALIEHPVLEGLGYDLLVVDEYQDLNACDLDVLHRIAARGCSLIAAGDDDQSIYSFRKATPAGIRRFPEEYPTSGDYTLSISQRCGSGIVEWSRFVIEGDPDRPQRPRLRAAEGSPDGEVALLAFEDQNAEARGVASLVRKLVEVDGLEPQDVLVLLRSDYNEQFSRLIKAALDNIGITYTDPEAVARMLAEQNNRRLLAVCRLLAHRQDSLAWATLLHLTTGIGSAFFDYICQRARACSAQFGEALLEAHAAGFPHAPTVPAPRASELVESVTVWLNEHPIPDPDNNAAGIRWGEWIVQAAGTDVAPTPTSELAELLDTLDETVDTGGSLGSFLGQIQPLGQDRARNESQAVRIMTMMGAKGLTVRAVILVALEEQIIPRQEPPLDEERRLLYVALTRAREFVYGTWARRRTGPTARAGDGRVQTRRTLTHFLKDGPVETSDGPTYIEQLSS